MFQKGLAFIQLLGLSGRGRQSSNLLERREKLDYLKNRRVPLLFKFLSSPHNSPSSTRLPKR